MSIRFGNFAPDFNKRIKALPAKPERRQHGQPTHWIEGASFGFITPLGAPKCRDTDVFVHRSALKLAAINEPAVGMLLDYVVGLGNNGRERAVKVWRAAAIEG